MLSMLIFIFLTFSSFVYGNDFPSPSREQIENQIKNIDRLISTKCQKERFYFMGTAACASLLLYFRNGFNYEQSVLYYSELLVKEGVVLFGGYCFHSYRELCKDRKKMEKKRDELEIELKSIRPNAIRPGEKVRIPQLPMGENNRRKLTSNYSDEYQTTVTTKSALPLKVVAIEDNQGHELINLARRPSNKRHASAIVLRSPRRDSSKEFDEKS